MIDTRLKNSLADCMGFLHILPNFNRGIRSYVFIKEQWHLINQSISYVLDRESEVSKFMDSLEYFMYKSPNTLYSYVVNKLNVKIPDNDYHREVKKVIEEYYSGFDTSYFFECPEVIHERIKSVHKENETLFFFSIYLEKLDSFSANTKLKYVMSKAKDRRNNRESYDLQNEGTRLANVFYKSLKLSVLDLKLSKHLYCFELEEIECLLIDNINLLLSHCEFIEKKLPDNNTYHNSLDIYRFIIELNLIPCINLLTNSNYYDNKSIPKEIDILVLKINKISTEVINLRADKTDYKFNFILFERVQNAFKYSFINIEKFSEYEKNLKGVENKKFLESSEYLKNLNYLVQKDRFPAIVNFNWSSTNQKFYQDYLKPILEKEEDTTIDFKSGIYEGYLSKYLEDVVVNAYKTNDKQRLLVKAQHLIRLTKHSNIVLYNHELIQSMLLDASAFEEYETYTKYLLRNSGSSEAALIEIFSIQRIKNILPFSGELFLSQVYWERQKKLTELFEEEIITYLDSYIESEGYYDLPSKLLKKYCSTEFINSNYESLKKDWIEEFFNSFDRYPIPKEDLLKKVNEFNKNGLEQESEWDLYPKRFSLAKEFNYDFDFFKIPKVQIPQTLLKLVELEFTSLYKKLISSFIIENDLKVGDDRWVSEKYLYFRIKECFPELPIVRHASPAWLGNQHFDIYLPSINVAIEYNGKQHYEPIKYFGGEKSFQHVKELDNQKYRVAMENNTTVIIHKYDDEIDTTIENLKKIIKQ